MTIALLFSLGTCIVQIQSVRVNFACTKRLFNLSVEAISMPARRVCVSGAQYFFEDQTKSYFMSLGHGVYIFEETRKSIPDVFRDMYCPGKFCSSRENCESFDGYLTTPRSIYGSGKCGAWLFVHIVPFMLQEHAKTTKTDKTRFFLAKER